MPTKKEQLLLRLDPEQIERIERLAKAWGLNKQGFIKMILARTFTMIEQGRIKLDPLEVASIDADEQEDAKREARAAKKAAKRRKSAA